MSGNLYRYQSPAAELHTLLLLHHNLRITTHILIESISTKELLGLRDNNTSP